MATTTPQNAPQKEATPPLMLSKIQGHPPLLNLGKVKKKKSKKLKKGKELPVEVHQHLQNLQANANLKGNSQHLVISYEAKPRKKRKKKNKLNVMGLKINRKKLKNRMKKSGIGF